MAAAVLCLICVKEENAKPKPGILPCFGCKQVFCTNHVAQHRQELANALDSVIEERNKLQEELFQCATEPNVSVQLDIIEEWVRKTIEQVHQAGEVARQQVIQKAKEQRQIVKDRCLAFSQELHEIRENENYFEQDVAKLQQKCEMLKMDLSQVNINVDSTDMSVKLNQAIIVKQTTTIAALSSYVEQLLQSHTPHRQMLLPHTGQILFADNYFLIRAGNQGQEYTLVNTNDFSMKSISFWTDSSASMFWSNFLNQFFSLSKSMSAGLFLIDPCTNSRKTITINMQGKPCSTLACFNDRIMLAYAADVKIFFTPGETLEEWQLSKDKCVEAPEPIARWRAPLSCQLDENIVQLAFNTYHIAIIITKRGQNTSSRRFELRTRGMVTVGHVQIPGQVFPHCSLLNVKNEWMIEERTDDNQPCHYTLIDKDFQVHKQPYLSSQYVQTLAVIENQSLLAVCHQQKTDDRNERKSLVLDLYQMTLGNNLVTTRKINKFFN